MIFRGVDDPNQVTVVHEFESVEAADQFINSPHLRERMESAGVQWPAELWIVEEA